MGYFDGLANSSFKQDAEGRDVFYPFGVLGKGRILPDPETAASVRRKVINFYKLLMFALLPLVIIVVQLHAPVGYLVVAVVVLTGGAWLYFRQLTQGLAISGERLSYAEAQRNAARSHSMWMLVLFAFMSAIFVVGGLFLIVVTDDEGRWIGLASALFFGACLGVFIWMILLKRRQGQT